MNKRAIPLFSVLCIFCISAKYPPCHQKTYDMLYKELLQKSLEDNDMLGRNTGIQILRQLCYGQISTLEQKNKTTYQLQRVK